MILFLFNGTYPEGMAMSNRLHLYCKSLLVNNVTPEVVIPCNIKPLQAGYHEGIKYSSFKNPVFIKNYSLRQLNSFFASFIFAYYCYRYSKKFKVIFISGFGWFSTSLMIMGAHFGGAKTIMEVNENPYSPEGGRLDPVWIRRIRRYMMLNGAFRIADGFIVISEKLHDLVCKYKNSQSHVIKIPILTDQIKESVTNIKKPDIPFILHTGALSQTKDGMIAVFEAYAKASKVLSDKLQFILTNKAMQPALSKKIGDIIMRNNLYGKVTFTGYLSKNELDELRRKCSLVVINKPSNWQNDYNFPTKLGEYMMSGIPAIVSNTGEMSKYLKDNDTAFLVSANDIDAIAAKIVFIVKNPEIAINVGIAGRNLALKEFHFMNHSGKITDFFNGFNRIKWIPQ